MNKVILTRAAQVMFSATWPRAVQKLASGFLRDAVQINIGRADELVVNRDVSQVGPPPLRFRNRFGSQRQGETGPVKHRVSRAAARVGRCYTAWSTGTRRRS